MEKVNIGSNRFTEIHATDEKGAGGAFHKYEVYSVPVEPQEPTVIFSKVGFQNGPVGENGVNGCHQEDLLAIVIHRLQCFQAGDYACRENALALTKLEEAMHWLNSRTASRQLRGVEGTSVA